jgi:dCTP deaminase
VERLSPPLVSTRYRVRVLLSDRDIRAEIDSGRVRLEPYDEEMVKPSSIDVRLDKFFRLFDNYRNPFIDPAQDQPDLTRLIGSSATSR